MQASPYATTQEIKFGKETSMKIVYCDSEYNRSKDANINVVCFSLLIISGKRRETVNVWLNGDEEKKAAFVETIEDLIMQNYTFVAFAVTAEGRALQSLGIDPRRIRWVDLFLEYRMLLNHNHREGCGKHLVNGKIKVIYPPIPKWEKVDSDKNRGTGMAPFNLSSALFKMVGVQIDTEHKILMRDLIIAGGPFNDTQSKAILEYCASDVIYLPELHEKTYRAIGRKLLPADRNKLNSEMYERGEYAARSAVMEAVGYPINYKATKNFSASTSAILFELQAEINALFPKVKAFESNKDGTKYKQKMKHIRAWVEEQGHENWMPTDKGALSLSLEAFQRYYDFSHDYPKESFGAQMVRLLKTKQSLNGFMPGSKKSFWDSVGSDQRVRPYMGIYRAQSGRSQPSSTGFIPLKSAWMRSLIQPKKGRAIVALDYAQQEFLLAALLSKDMNMVAAYHSGDPYLHTGKLAGAIPQDATRESHGPLRDKFKSTALGIQYMMASKGLAGKLTRDTGVKHTEDEAQALIDKFEEAFPDYQDWKDEVWAEYRADGYLKLPCGWTMFGDNKNRRSVCNFPIQGCGSSIMRKAVQMAQDEGLEVIFTLHDALYVECASKDIVHTLNELASAMEDAVKYYFIDTPVEKYAVCRMDPTLWSPDFPGQTFDTDLGPVECTALYIDGRAVEEYKKFKKYFAPPDEIKFLTSL